MKAVRVHAYGKRPSVDEIPEPRVTGPLDVLVQVGAAGLCRTDLHIVEGQWAEATGIALPYTLGHENAGWVHAVGDGVTNAAPGDTVILHPAPSCGLCRACRAGEDMHCSNGEFPGLSGDGGMAEYLRTSARAWVKLDPSTQPADVAALADAGITAYHAVRKAIPLLYPGTTCVVIGAGCQGCAPEVGGTGAFFMATGGTITISAVSATTLSGTLSNVTFTHVTIANTGATPTFQSTPVNDSCDTRINSLSFTAPVQQQ